MDRVILYLTAFSRAFCTSLIGVLMGLYLGRRGLSSEAIGIIVTAGLLGAALGALLVTLVGDRLGRRRVLVVYAGLTALGTAAFAFATEPLAQSAAAFVGMLNGMGRDRGAALVLEQAILPATTTAERRTDVIARYTMLQDLGHALGALIAGIPTLFAGARVFSGEAHQALLLACATIGLCSGGLYFFLSPAVEQRRTALRPALSPESRRTLTRISALFGLDGLGGGFLTTALLSYFFFERFGVSEGAIGLLFFGARLMNAVSHLGAAFLARRIGLVNTMVFTHIPSSLLLVTVAFAPSFWIAAWLFLLREGLVEMDVPTRQSYVLAVVAPEERTLASGITNLVRLCAWSVAPVFAGALMGTDGLFLPLIVGAGMKITYDLLLYVSFRNVRPPEER